MHVYMHVYTYRYACICLHLHLHIYVCTCMCVYISTIIYIYIYIYVCVYVCMHVWMYVFLRPFANLRGRAKSCKATAANPNVSSFRAVPCVGISGAAPPYSIASAAWPKRFSYSTTMEFGLRDH